MPGFKIGGAGDGPSSGIETLRQHRWLITKLGPIGTENLLVARDLVLPEYRIDRQEILGGLIYYKFAKSVKWEDISVTFYDTGKILDELCKWKQLVYDNSSGIKKHSPNGGYKQDCIFELLDGTGSPLNTITAKNAWPASIAQGQLSYTSTEIKVVTVTLAYDFAEGQSCE